MWKKTTVLTMKLEEAVHIVDETQRYRGLAAVSPVSIDTHALNPNAREQLTQLIFRQRSFYSELDSLQRWATAPLPDPANYGSTAVEFITAERRTYYGLSGFLGGDAIILASVIGMMNNYIPPLLVPVFGEMLLIGGALLLWRSRDQTEELQFDPHAGQYIRDLAAYYGSAARFTRKGLDILGDRTRNYVEALERFQWLLQKEGYSEEQLRILQLEKDNITPFAAQYKSIIKALAKSKKGPVPPWGGGISPHVITAMGAMDIGSFKEAFDLTRNLPELVREYQKGPTLVLMN